MIGTGDLRTLYHNADGVCAGDEITYCRNATGCPDESECVVQPVTATVTATVLSADGTIVHKATQTVEFVTEPTFKVYSSNIGVTVLREVVETIDYQRALPNSVLKNRFRETLFSENAPYAPRFLLFAPTEARPWPHNSVPNLQMTQSGTTGQLMDGDREIGTFEIIAPDGATASISDQNFGWSTTENRFVGTLFTIPIEVTSEGLYTCRVSMIDGSVAESRVIVEPASPAPSTAFPTALQTLAPSRSFVPSEVPSEIPSDVPSDQPSGAPTFVKSQVPTIAL